MKNWSTRSLVSLDAMRIERVKKYRRSQLDEAMMLVALASVIVLSYVLPYIIN